MNAGNGSGEDESAVALGTAQRRVLCIGDRRSVSGRRQPVHANHRQRIGATVIHPQRLRQHRPGHHPHPHALGTVSARLGDGPSEDPAQGRARNTAQHGPAQSRLFGPEFAHGRLQFTVRPHGHFRLEDRGPIIGDIRTVYPFQQHAFHQIGQREVGTQRTALDARVPGGMHPGLPGLHH